jgi:hypothetical protein
MEAHLLHFEIARLFSQIKKYQLSNELRVFCALLNNPLCSSNKRVSMILAPLGHHVALFDSELGQAFSALPENVTVPLKQCEYSLNNFLLQTLRDREHIESESLRGLLTAELSHVNAFKEIVGKSDASDYIVQIAHQSMLVRRRNSNELIYWDGISKAAHQLPARCTASLLRREVNAFVAYAACSDGTLQQLRCTTQTVRTRTPSQSISVMRSSAFAVHLTFLHAFEHLLVAIDDQGAVLVFNTRTMQNREIARIDGAISAQFFADVLFVGTQNAIHAIDPDDGTLLQLISTAEGERRTVSFVCAHFVLFWLNRFEQCNSAEELQSAMVGFDDPPSKERHTAFVIGRCDANSIIEKRSEVEPGQSKNLIGCGAFASVYSMERRGHVVALKRLAPSYSPWAHFAVYGDEVDILSCLNHVNAPVLRGISASPLSKDLLMSYAGSPLHLVFTTLTATQRALVALEALYGLHYLHAMGIIHRDVKLENIALLSDARSAFVVRLIDFGTACYVDQGRHGASAECATSFSVQSEANEFLGSHSSHDSTVGTLRFMAPEVMRAYSGLYSTRADMYSFGCVLWSLLHGALPWSSLSDADVQEQVLGGACLPIDAKLGSAKLIASLLSEQPEQRPSALEALKILEARQVAKEPFNANLAAAILQSSTSSFLVSENQLGALSAEKQTSKMFELCS